MKTVAMRKITMALKRNKMKMKRSPRTMIFWKHFTN